MDNIRKWVSRPQDAPPATMTAESVEQKAIHDMLMTFDNRNITYTGDLTGFNYDDILRDKQRNINQLYQLADYFVDKDPIVRGIVKGVYATFSVTDWKLIGESEKTKQKYEQYYERIGLRDRMVSIFYQYFKYGNVYIYLNEDGSLKSFPVHKCRIANVTVNGEPVVEFNAGSLLTDLFVQGATAKKEYMDDDEIEVQAKGFPPEVQQALKHGDQWVQLNPENTFVLQDLKEDWTRYAIPLIAACLPGLSKKALIEKYEDALLNLGINSFIHVKYGGTMEGKEYLPNVGELSQVNTIFRKAMKGSALAVTNQLAESEVVQADTRDLFQYDKYAHVNAEILSAGGISGIIVSGRAEDGSTFASAQVSMNTADKRIELARKNFCELMNKINRRVNGRELTRNSADKVPKFTLLPIDLSGTSKFAKTCTDLWKEGCISTETLLQTHGFDYGQEVERMKTEQSNGTYELMRKDAQKTETDSDGKVGRPEVSDEDRTSDKGKAQTGKQPKPSNPEGSLDD